MAGSRTKAPMVGSAPWILGETKQAEQFLGQEVEEFSFSVRNELEWLNEHMTDVLAMGKENIAEMFKTPGKLRGKTPRTARKINPEARAPLTDIFAPTTQPTTSPQKTQFYKNLAKFQVAEDSQKNAPQPSPRVNRLPNANKQNTDSGYHGVTDDEMEIDQMPTVLCMSPAKKVTIHKSPLPTVIPEEKNTTDESFVSAQETRRSETASVEKIQDTDDVATIPDDDEMDLVAVPEEAPSNDARLETDRPKSPRHSVSNETASALDSVIQHQTVANDTQESQQQDGARTPSDGSSPVKQIVRKSSLTFASLPAREPLAKKSVGARISRTSHVDQVKQSAPQRQSQYPQFTSGKSFGGSQSTAATALSQFSTQDDAMELDDTQPTSQESQSAEATFHNKTSTQRLHERINMLGQSKELRPSKAPTLSQPISQPSYPQLPSFDQEATGPDSLSKDTAGAEADEDDDDDWIAPIKSTNFPQPPSRPGLFKSQSTEVMEQISGRSSISQFEKPTITESPSRAGSPLRPVLGHSKSASASAISSPAKPPMGLFNHQKAASVAIPDMSTVLESNTPPGSPAARKHPDGPLSASKAKFFSVLKSAKERLIASAGISAQAKMETLSPSRSRTITQMPSLEQIFSPKRDARAADNASVYTASTSPSKPEEGRRTRSSTEKRKEKAAKEQQRHEDNLEKARAKVREEVAVHTQKTKAANHKPVVPSGESKFETTSSTSGKDDDAPAPPPKSQLPTALPQKQKEPRRFLKTPKETQPKQPVVVKVAMNRQFPQHQASNSTMASSYQEAATVVQGPTTRQNIAVKNSNDNIKSAAGPSAKQKDVAAKKKETAAQRRADLKREQEQKRLKQEEERRLEQQRKAAEQRTQDAKRAAAQKQAAESKSRQQTNRPPSRQVNNLNSAMQLEKSQGPAHPRADLGGARPVSRMNTVLDHGRPLPPVNPAKPPKRIFQPDDDESVSRPALQRAGPSYQQNDGKRRKTEDFDEEPVEAGRPVMKPPIRQSNIRKEQQNRFPHGYMPAQTPASQTLLKHAVTSAQQHKSNQPHELAKFSSAKIPFAENPNPAGPSTSQYQSAYKTPVRNNTAQTLQHTAKSSPHYPPSEAITLPEIATDSEDEDSDNEFQQPSWADSPALRELLIAQQLVDPETIFGPIPPLQMEEIFKNKDRHKRFRDRTSSANWNGADRLTEEEKQRDREARERLMRDGAWTFKTNGEH